MIRTGDTVSVSLNGTWVVADVLSCHPLTVVYGDGSKEIISDLSRVSDDLTEPREADLLLKDDCGPGCPL